MLIKFLPLCLCFVLAQALKKDAQVIGGRYRRDTTDLTFVSELTFNETQKNFILDEHNRFRREAGSSDMRLMLWDPELATIAQEHSKNCIFEHSNNGLGENLFIGSGSFESRARTFVTNFHNEISDFSYDSNSCAPDKVCGHYTQIVWADTYLVGCGAALCTGGTDYTLITCNYKPPGNVHDFSGPLIPFKKGASCSGCKDTTDSCDNGLCANPSRNVPVTVSSTVSPTSTSTNNPVTTSSSTNPSPSPSSPTTSTNPTSSSPSSAFSTHAPSTIPSSSSPPPSSTSTSSTSTQSTTSSTITPTSSTPSSSPPPSSTSTPFTNPTSSTSSTPSSSTIPTTSSPPSSTSTNSSLPTSSSPSSTSSTPSSSTIPPSSSPPSSTSTHSSLPTSSTLSSTSSIPSSSTIPPSSSPPPSSTSTPFSTHSSTSSTIFPTSSSTFSTTTWPGSSTPPFSTTSEPGSSTPFSSTSSPIGDCEYPSRREYLQMLEAYRATLREWREGQEACKRND